MTWQLYVQCFGVPFAFLGLTALAPVPAIGQAGSITGTVTAANVPQLPPLEVTKNQEYCGQTVPSESVVATSDGRLRYAIVYLDGVPFQGELQAGALTITNEQCAFVPHVQAGTVASKLEITSADPILHNTHLSLVRGRAARSLVNLALPNKGTVLDASRATRRPGLVELKCDAHDWMSGYIMLFDHPYSAVTAADGSFTIPNVPAGTYTMKVWHEKLGELTQEVVVTAGESTAVSLAFQG